MHSARVLYCCSMYHSMGLLWFPTDLGVAAEGSPITIEPIRNDAELIDFEWHFIVDYAALLLCCSIYFQNSIDSE